MVQAAAAEFATAFSERSPSDGKSIGTTIESAFRRYLESQGLSDGSGSSAKGVDIPDLNLDIKTTQMRRPQSSAPYSSAEQRIWGLGYNLIIFPYEWESAQIKLKTPLFIPEDRTADSSLTKQLHELLQTQPSTEAMIGWLWGVGIQAPKSEMNRLAQQIIADPPKRGWISFSDARQWRLKYPLQQLRQEGALCTAAAYSSQDAA